MKNKLKKIVNKLIAKDSIFSNLLYRLLVIYRKIKYIKYKRKYIVENEVLFDASKGFEGKIKQLYEEILYDSEFEGMQLFIAVQDSSEISGIIKDKTTRIVKRKSKKYNIISARAKFWIKNTVDLHITPKKEQTLVYVNPDENVNNDPKKDKLVEKYNQKYVSYYIDNHVSKPKENEVKVFWDEWLREHHIQKDKTIIQYKIFFNELNEYYYDDFFKKENLDLLYNKYHKKYQILINCNFDVSTDFESYQHFFVNVSKEPDYLIDYCSDILVANKQKLIDTNNLHDERTLLYSNYKLLYSEMLQKNIFLYSKTDIKELITFLDNYKEKKDEKSYCYFIPIELKNALHDFLNLKENAKKTVTVNLLKRKILIPLKDFKIKAMGFGRVHFFVLSKDYKLLKKYHNAYKGKRCFLIGNGPSLKAEDLTFIKDEISFGCNLIYKIYDQTEWRPDFFCVSDRLYVKDNGAEILSQLTGPLFTLSGFKKSMEYHRRRIPTEYPLIYLDMISAKENGKYKNVSPMAYLFPGRSVMTVMLSLAIYMGFDEIYLIGVDCTSAFSNNGHFIKNYKTSQVRRQDMKRIAKKLGMHTISEDEIVKYYHDGIMDAYQKIKDYAEKKNIKIYNSTRGGALEIYERKKLEDVLSEKSNKNNKK